VGDESAFDQSGFRVRFGWGERDAALLVPLAARVVIVDVLRFTTAVSVAIEQGATVYPYRWRDESAAAFAEQHSAQLAGDWGKDGPSLSPLSLRALNAGDRLVLPSPNGATLTLLAAEHRAEVMAGSLRNSSAVAKHCRQPGVVAVIAAGERWTDGSLRPCVEDMVGAGAVLSALAADECSPEALAAVAAFHGARTELEPRLRECGSGRELVERSFADDITMAAELDATGTCPILRDGAYVDRTSAP
jgi:2-phosphosulfolactate phosphatase